MMIMKLKVGSQIRSQLASLPAQVHSFQNHMCDHSQDMHLYDVLCDMLLLSQGEELIEHSSQLIHQGEVVRVTTGMWTNNITLFLFDHQLVYCKKVRQCQLQLSLLSCNTILFWRKLPTFVGNICSSPQIHVHVCVRARAFVRAHVRVSTKNDHEQANIAYYAFFA
jgi:hypothetical protein